MSLTGPKNNKQTAQPFSPSDKAEAAPQKHNIKRVGILATLGGTAAAAGTLFITGGLALPLVAGAIGAAATGYAFSRGDHDKALGKYDVKTVPPSVNVKTTPTPVEVSKPTPSTRSLLEHPSIQLDFSPKYPAVCTPCPKPADLQGAVNALQEDVSNWKSWFTITNLKITHLMEKIDDLPIDERAERIQSIKEHFQAQRIHLHERNTETGDPPAPQQIEDVQTFIDTLSKRLDIQINNVNAELALREEIQHHTAFDGFPTKELWRLVIDGQDHETRGKYGYENEPGYLAGCFNMLTCMLKRRREEQPLDSDFLITLHDTAAQSTHLSCAIHADQSFRQGIGPNSFPLVPGSNLSEEGWEEIKDNMHPESELLHQLTNNRPTMDIPVQLKDQYSKISVEFRYDYDQWMTNKEVTYNARFQCEGNNLYNEDGKKNIERIKANIQTLIDQCYAALEQAGTQEAKEKAITLYMAKIERMHPFPDANLRTIAFGAINMLRLEQGLLPLVWEDPNQLDGFSSKELVKIQQQGAARFQSFKTVVGHLPDG